MYVTALASNIDTMWDFPPAARMLERLASFTRLILFDARSRIRFPSSSPDLGTLDGGPQRRPYGSRLRPGPGEILCSRTVRDLVVGSEFPFEDRGLRALKGVPDEWQLYAVNQA